MLPKHDVAGSTPVSRSKRVEALPVIPCHPIRGLVYGRTTRERKSWFDPSVHTGTQTHIRFTYECLPGTGSFKLRSAGGGDAHVRNLRRCAPPPVKHWHSHAVIAQW